MTSEEQFRKLFTECVDEMRKPIIDLGEKYDTDVLISSLFEVGMRLSLLKYGTQITARFIISRLRGPSNNKPAIYSRKPAWYDS